MDALGCRPRRCQSLRRDELVSSKYREISSKSGAVAVPYSLKLEETPGAEEDGAVHYLETICIGFEGADELPEKA